jgi:hypothetical protein
LANLYSVERWVLEVVSQGLVGLDDGDIELVERSTLEVGGKGHQGKSTAVVVLVRHGFFTSGGHQIPQVLVDGTAEKFHFNFILS